MYKWEPYMEEFNSELGEHHRCERLALITEHFRICVNTYNRRKFKPYFKVKRYDENNNLIGLCRIYFHRPVYITGYDENMELTEEEIYEIMSHFIKIRGSVIDDSYWEWLIFKANDIMYMCYDVRPILQNIPIPNYNLLIKDRKLAYKQIVKW